MSGSIPAAYFITFRCFGTWLPGDDRGSVDRENNQYNTPYLPPNRNRYQFSMARLSQSPVILNDRQRALVESTIREVCDYRGWRLYAINVRTNHVHVVVTADNTPERVMGDFKSYATRRLREKNAISQSDRIWAQHGSTRYLWNWNHIKSAIHYVLYEQDEKPFYLEE
ncbi:MAG: transposase [Acidobacteria bacterium]|nr:transposase [Acidobacteriota bacterium]